MRTEKFNDVPPLQICPDCEIERDGKQYPEHVGKLWMGSTWFTVAEARELRDWLNRAIP